MKIPNGRCLVGLTVAATAGLLPALVAPLTAAPAAAAPDCRTIGHGAWVETVCGVYPTQAACEAAGAARGPIGYMPTPDSRSGLVGKPGTMLLTCIGPNGGRVPTAAVGGTTDGQWHLSHIGP